MRKDLKKRMYRDMIREVWPAAALYAASELLGALLTVYTANVLGAFADAVFRLDWAYGVANVGKLALCVGLTAFAVPAIYMGGEISIFRGALRHDRMILSRFLDKTHASATAIDEGEAQFRIEDDPNSLRCGWSDLMTRAVMIPFALVYLLFSAFTVSPLYTLVVFAASLIKLAVPIAVRKAAAKYDARTRDYNAAVRAMETDITEKPCAARTMGLSISLTRKLDERFQTQYRDTARKDISLKALSGGVLSFLDTFCVLIILLFGSVLVSKGSVTPGAAAAMTGYFAAFNLILANADFLIRNLPIQKNLEERMAIFYEDEEETAGEPAPEGELSARELSFAYGDKTIFRNLSFTVKPGGKTAILGPNGSGKSTLVKLVCGLMREYRGALTLGGREMRACRIDSWRERFAYAAQDAYLFAGTVRENVRLGKPDGTDAEAERVMRALGIESLADRAVSADQNDLSGGEAQKVSIARALMKGAPILILDEPGNNLDADSLIWLQNFIRTTDRTVLFISHGDKARDIADATIEMDAP